MKTYTVHVKPPFTSAMLTDVTGTLARSKESDNYRVRRTAIGTQLEGLTGVKPTWRMRTYSYLVDLTDKQAREVGSWKMVRRVEAK